MDIMNFGSLLILLAVVAAAFALVVFIKKQDDKKDEEGTALEEVTRSIVTVEKPAPLPSNAELIKKTKKALKEFAQDTWGIELDVTKTKATMIEDLLTSHKEAVTLYKNAD